MAQSPPPCPRGRPYARSRRDHLVQLRDPADRAREREDRGEHRHRDADRALHEAGIEIDFRVELARDEVIVFGQAEEDREGIQTEDNCREPDLEGGELTFKMSVLEAAARCMKFRP